MQIILGVDFDNTIVNCADLFHTLAVQRKLIPHTTTTDKQAVRDAVRETKNGEIEWQKLQALVYGPLLQQARPILGVLQALKACLLQNIQIYIISHKTRYAAQDISRTDLRVTAMRWLKNNCIVSNTGPVNERNVFFEASRADKINRIKTMNCTHFVDDLAETFQHPNFPPDVTKLLFDPSGNADVPEFIKTFHTWENIVDYVLKTTSTCHG